MSLNGLLLPVIPKFPTVHPDAELEVLKEMPVETLYLALKRADAQSSLWFFQNATPEQVQGIVDIDCWEGDQFLPNRFEELFRHITLVSPPQLSELMKKMDPEIIVRGLLELAEVQDFDPQEPPNVDEASLLLSPDSRYALILHTQDPETREILMQWMNKLSAANIDLLRRHLESCKWEQKSDLEEFGYQIKRGRLEDMGFVDRHEALALYAAGVAADYKKKLLGNPLGVDTKRSALTRKVEDDDNFDPAAINESFLPQILAEPIFSEGITAEAFRNISDLEMRNMLLGELLRTFNGVLAADNVIHQELDTIGAAARRAREYFDLGLTYLSGGKVTDAAGMLENFPLGEVFRLGWLVVQDLGRASRELTKKFTPQLFGDNDATLLRALQGRHPELDAEQRRDAGIKGENPRSMEAVLALGTRIAQLNVLGGFFTKDLAVALQLEAIALQANESAYARLLAGLFREASGAQFASSPMTPEEWDALSPHFKGEKSLRDAAKLVAERCPPAARGIFETRLSEHIDELVAFIKAKPGSRPDPRYFKAIAIKEPK